MASPPVRAFLDASVLYPVTLRNLFMRLTLAGRFQATWSASVHEEWIRSVLRDRPDLTRPRLEALRAAMDLHAEDALAALFSVGWWALVDAASRAGAGVKRPGDPALRLLTIVQRKGLQAIARVLGVSRHGRGRGTMTSDVIARESGLGNKCLNPALETPVTTTTLSSLEVIMKFFKHMERGDYDSAMTSISEDCDYINPPPLGAVRGPAAVRGVLEPFFAPTLENELKVLRSSSTGPVVFIERFDRHRLTDKWVELPVTGVFEVREGRITYWRDYFDAATILSEWPTA